uniref:RING-type domain-containing protein n=1 Tax=Oryza rufipogon TaxID=4529 RepID=A0A0E0MZN7_ORYRU
MAAVETRISITDFSCKMSDKHAVWVWGTHNLHNKATSESTSTTTACSSVHIRCNATVKYASRRLRGNGKPVRDRQPDKPWTTEETRPASTTAPGSDEACGICQEKFGMGCGAGASSDPVNLPCEHAFHANCVLAWFYKGNTCPVCSHDVCGQLVAAPWTKLAA